MAFAEAGERDMALEFLQPNSEPAAKELTTAVGGQATSVPAGLGSRMIQKFESFMAAVTFAEAGEPEMALEFLGTESYSDEKQAAQEAGLKMQKTTSLGLTDKISKVAEAVTFAEAGEHEYARSLMREEVLQKKEKGRILVVGREYSFSDHLMSYATNMATRMGREIVALNVTDSDVGFKFLSTYHKNVKEDFQRHAAENAEVFKNKADKEGVGFEHVIKFGDPDKAIRSICDEIGQITYALTEPEMGDSGHPADAEQQWEIPVFCIVPQAA
ncbi:universal stress protein [Thermodesulfobacteriota bacterium]